MPYSFTLKYLSTTITFQSDNPSIIKFISFIFHHLRSDAPAESKRIYTIEEETTGKGYSLFQGKKVLFKNFQLDTAMENIEISVESMVMAENPGILFFHAGAVSDGLGKVTLFLAGSGDGKTTLCAILANENFFLEGDELVGIHKEKMPVPVFFKKAPKLRRESLPFLKDRGKQLIIHGEKNKEAELIYWLPDEHDRPSPGYKKKIKRIFFIHFSPNKPNSISMLSPSDTIKGLVNTCHNFSHKRKMAFDIIMSLADQAETFEITYNRPDFVVSCVKNSPAH